MESHKPCTMGEFWHGAQALKARPLTTPDWMSSLFANAIEDFYTEDCVLYVPPGVFVGHDALDKFAGDLRATHPASRVTFAKDFLKIAVQKLNNSITHRSIPRPRAPRRLRWRTGFDPGCKKTAKQPTLIVPHSAEKKKKKKFSFALYKHLFLFTRPE